MAILSYVSNLDDKATTNNREHRLGKYAKALGVRVAKITGLGAFLQYLCFSHHEGILGGLLERETGLFCMIYESGFSFGSR